MTSTTPLDIIKARQRAWAQRSGRVLDEDGYCASADDNLFQRLSDTARDDFDRGGGGELGRTGERGKIQATHSSAALACNWFDYWRERDLGVLSSALSVPNPFVTLRLEAHVPTGMRGADANLDVLLTTADGSLFGIESKYAEPYTPTAAKSVLKSQYFAQGRSRWTDVGLPGCQVVAERLRTAQHNFTVLDVAQLLKHMLALARTGNRWTLCCLWYEVPGSLADGHRADLRTFTAQIGSDAEHFMALTYQELFAGLETVVGAGHVDYMDYLRDRYLSE
jgi:Restriction Endonuclease associating with ARP